jgi:NADPH-dependent curcumin reductase
MPPWKNRQIVLEARPAGPPKLSDFRLVEALAAEPGDGEVLCRTIYLSLDPYMRGRMNEARSYARPVDVGQVMVGGTVGEVIASRYPGVSPGAFVLAYGGWQEYCVVPGWTVRKLDSKQLPLSTALGVVGMPGMTAWVGVLDVGRAKSAETVVVSAAAGAVGSAAGQIAKIHGCRAIGIAGSRDKCDHVVRELGFDACVSYRDDDFFDALRAACPSGIDVYFDNVGGDVLKAVLRLINVGARIAICGLISQYNAAEPSPGPNLGPVLVNRATIRGFIVSDHAGRTPDFLADATRWVQEGRLKYRETLVSGLEKAPEAFLGLFEGKNVGKLLVRVSPDPTR